MRYLVEPRGRMYVKGYGFLSFAKNIGTHATKVAKNKSNKYSRKRIDSAKKKKIVSKRTIRKTAEATGDLIGNKIADKITRILKSQQNDEANNEILTKRKVYISRKKAQLFDELRLVE